MLTSRKPVTHATTGAQGAPAPVLDTAPDEVGARITDENVFDLSGGPQSCMVDAATDERCDPEPRPGPRHGPPPESKSDGRGRFTEDDGVVRVIHAQFKKVCHGPRHDGQWNVAQSLVPKSLREPASFFEQSLAPNGLWATIAQHGLNSGQPRSRNTHTHNNDQRLGRGFGEPPRFLRDATTRTKCWPSRI